MESAVAAGYRLFGNDVEGRQVLQSILDWIRGTAPENEEWPVCPVHYQPMELIRTLGTAARYSDQESVPYTLLYRCAVEGCDEQATRDRLRTQVPVPGTSTKRPAWAERDH